MARKKLTRYDKLKQSIIADMKERHSYSSVDDHQIDVYINLVRLVDELMDSIDSVVAEGGRSGEPVADPALVRLPAMQSSVLATARNLGIGPYSRKLISGTKKDKPKVATTASMLRPIDRSKKIS